MGTIEKIKSAEERTEGHFRREWKIAAERTHHTAAGMAFIVPVVVDTTLEANAAVPEEFMKVQWARLPGARTSPKFVEQIRRLLEAPRKATPGARPATAAPPVHCRCQRGEGGLLKSGP